MKKNKSTKTILSLFLTLVLAFTCMIPAFADESECPHSDTRVETIEKPADCTHYYSKEVKTICNDCGECIEDMFTIGNKYYHAETETIEIHEKSTCAKVGRDIVWVRCTLCGATVYRTETQQYAIAHIDTSECYETRIETTPATCTTDGHIDTVVWCNECEVEVSRESETIPATGHQNIKVVTTTQQEADCYHVDEKEIKTICNDCGKVISTEHLLGSDVKHGEIETIDLSTPATCISKGMLRIEYRCKLCGQTVGGATQPMVSPAHPVNPETNKPDCYETRIEETPATCTQEGHKDTVLWCNECNIEVNRKSEPIPASGHKWSEWKEQNGKKIRTCSVCEAKEEKVVENPQTEDNTPPIVRVVRNIVNTFRNIFTRLFSLFKK